MKNIFSIPSASSPLKKRLLLIFFLPFFAVVPLRSTQKEDIADLSAQQEGALSSMPASGNKHQRINEKKRKNYLRKVFFIGGGILCFVGSSYGIWWANRSIPSFHKQLKYRSLKRAVEALPKSHNIQKEEINNEILLEAIGEPKEYDREFLKWLIEVKKADVNYVSKARKKKTVLFIALEQKQDEALIRWLINSQGADCTCKDTAENTMLHIAVRQGYNKAFIQWLVKERRVDCTQKNMHGETVLPAALRAGYDETFIKEWLMKQLDPSEALREILHYFGRESIDYEKCKKLIIHLKRQGGVDAKDKEKKILTLALRGGYPEAFIEWIFAQKMVVLGDDEKYGSTANLWFEAILKKDHPIVFYNLLIEQGVLFSKGEVSNNLFLRTIDYFGDQVHTKENTQKCMKIISFFKAKQGHIMSSQSLNKAFMLALKKGMPCTFVLWLTDQQILDPNKAFWDFDKALWDVLDYFADQSKPIEMRECQTLIEHLITKKGVDINQEKPFVGETVLTLALKSGYPEAFIEWLMEQGADPKAANKMDQTIVDIAFLMKYSPGFIKKLMKKDIPVSAYIFVNEKNIQPTFKLALECKLVPEEELDLEFFNLLISQEQWEVNKSLWQVIEYFGSQAYYDLSRGYVMIYKGNRHNKERCKAIIEYLIEKGADIHAKESNTRTALTMAITYDYPVDFIKWLIDQKGVDVNRALLEIIYCGKYESKSEKELGKYKEILNHLRSKDSFDPNYKDGKGSTALELSIEAEYPAEFSIWLIERGMDLNLALFEVSCSRDLRYHPFIPDEKEKRIIKILEFLESKKVNMNSKNDNGDTTLSLALAHKCPVDLISILIRMGANPNQDEEVKRKILKSVVYTRVSYPEEMRFYYQSIMVTLIMQGKFDLDTKVQAPQVFGVLDGLCTQKYNMAIGAFCLRCREEDRLYCESIISSLAPLREENSNILPRVMLRLICTFLPSSFQKRLCDSNATICFNAWELANPKAKVEANNRKELYLQRSPEISNHYIALYQENEQKKSPEKKAEVTE